MRLLVIALVLTTVASLCSSCLAQDPVQNKTASELGTHTSPIVNTIQVTPTPIPYWQLQNKAPLFITIQELSPALKITVSVVKKLQFADKIAVSGTNIWMISAAGDGGAFVRYDIATNLSTNYTVPIGSGYGSPTDLLLTRDGTVWALRTAIVGPDTTFIDTYYRDRNKYPYWQLQRYDAKIDHLLPVQDLDRILFGVESGDASSDASICEDNKGRLWMVIDTQLVVYDPVSNKAKRIRPGNVTIDGSDNTIGTIQCDTKGHLWLIVNGIAPDGRQIWTLYRLEEGTNELTSFGFPIGDERSNRFFGQMIIDHLGNIWVTDRTGIFKLTVIDDGTHRWKVIERPTPIFAPANTTELVFARYVAESRDGMLWFSSERTGLLRYDPATDEWQHALPINSALAEDQYGNLWAAGDGQVYKCGRCE